MDSDGTSWALMDPAGIAWIVIHDANTEIDPPWIRICFKLDIYVTPRLALVSFEIQELLSWSMDGPASEKRTNTIYSCSMRVDLDPTPLVV